MAVCEEVLAEWGLICWDLTDMLKEWCQHGGNLRGWQGQRLVDTQTYADLDVV